MASRARCQRGGGAHKSVSERGGGEGRGQQGVVSEHKQLVVVSLCSETAIILNQLFIILHYRQHHPPNS